MDTFHEINGSRQHTGGLKLHAQPCAHCVYNSQCVLGNAHAVRNPCKHEATHHLPYIPFFRATNFIWKIKREKIDVDWLFRLFWILLLLLLLLLLFCVEWLMVYRMLWTYEQRTNGTNSVQVAHVARTHCHRNWRRGKKKEKRGEFTYWVTRVSRNVCMFCWCAEIFNFPMQILHQMVKRMRSRRFPIIPNNPDRFSVMQINVGNRIGLRYDVMKLFWIYTDTILAYFLFSFLVFISMESWQPYRIHTNACTE